MDRGARQATVHAVVRVRYNFKPPPSTTGSIETGAFGVKLEPTRTLTLLLWVALSKSYNLSNVLICRRRITVVLSQSCLEDKRRYFVLFCFVFLAVSCSLWDLSSPIRDQTHTMAVKTWSPDHWTTRGFPRQVLKFYFFSLFFKINFYWSVVALPCC